MTDRREFLGAVAALAVLPITRLSICGVPLVFDECLPSGESIEERCERLMLEVQRERPVAFARFYVTKVPIAHLQRVLFFHDELFEQWASWAVDLGEFDTAEGHPWIQSDGCFAGLDDEGVKRIMRLRRDEMFELLHLSPSIT